MTGHKIGSREQWLAARIALLKEEKELTRRSDELAKKRQELPWVKVEKDYKFETEDGTVTLKDLFGGRSQLIVYHFMFGPDFQAGCPSCSSLADSFNGIFVHLENHDVAFSAVSRAPLPTLQAYKKRMEWSFPWASSGVSDFNTDFSVVFTAEQQLEGAVTYNYSNEPTFVWKPDSERGGGEVESQFAATCGIDVPTFHRDRPGMSAFAMQDGEIYHTYSAYARGLDGLWTMYQWLDRAPLGRNETGLWFKRHDEYASAKKAPSSKSSCCS